MHAEPEESRSIATAGPAWTWPDRLDVLGSSLGIVGGAVAAVSHAHDGEWSWTLLFAVLVAWLGTNLFRTLRRRRDPHRETVERRRRAAAEAVREMTPARMLAVAESRGLDLATSGGRIGLMKALREEDLRLGLLEVKTLVDGLQEAG